MKRKKKLQYLQILSSSPKSQTTTQERYGTDNVSQSPIIKEKSKETCLKKYGKDNFFKTDEFKKKNEKTSLATYGTKKPCQSSKVKAKIEQSNLKIYGYKASSQNPLIKKKSQRSQFDTYGKWYSQTQECKDRIISTNLEKRGVSNPMQDPACKQKQVEDCRHKYEVDFYRQTPECNEKLKNTYQSKYGVDWYFQTPGFRETARTLYKITRKKLLEIYGPVCHARFLFEEERFDSSWELIFWMYCKIHDIRITRPRRGIVYVSSDHKIHHYFPDFKIGKHLVEIKGDQFLGKGSLINPYTEDPEIQDIFRAKGECMKRHRILVVSGKDISAYKNSTESLLGKDWWKKFRI